MTIQQAEKIAKHIAEIKELDAKIIELGKMANMASEEKHELKIQLSCGKQQEVKTSCTYTFTIWGGSPSIEGDEWKQKKDETSGFISISETMDAKHFFLFCNFMMQKYEERRNYLLNKLKL